MVRRKEEGSSVRGKLRLGEDSGIISSCILLMRTCDQNYQRCSMAKVPSYAHILEHHVFTMRGKLLVHKSKFPWTKVYSESQKFTTRRIETWAKIIRKTYWLDHPFLLQIYLNLRYPIVSFTLRIWGHRICLVNDEYYRRGKLRLMQYQSRGRTKEECYSSDILFINKYWLFLLW